MKKSTRKIPEFKSEDEEFDFWSSHDSTEFFSETEEINEPLEITKPKRKKQRVTMLLDPQLKSQLQKIAEEKGIPYQTLIQMWLKERVRKEIKNRLAS
jgi:predicted DNA binding CopG/RHH family protein